MPKIILTILAVFFLFIPVVKAFDVDEFAEDFYDKIQNQVEYQEKITVERRISASTALPPELIQNLIQGTMISENQADLDAWCANTGKLFIQTHCEEELKKMISQEMDLAKLETEMNLNLVADEIWANGTLADSAFDLVVDLNLIDIILFGQEAKIPLARWSKFEQQDINISPGYRVPGSGDLVGSDTLDLTNSNDIEDLFKEISDEIDLLETKKETASETAETAIGVLKKTSDIYGSQFQCIDPNSFVFINLGDDNVLESGNSDVLVEDRGDELDVTGSIGTTDDEFWKGKGEGFDRLNLSGKQDCDNPLYGGYYCKTPRGGVGVQNATEEGCDPLKGVCKKCLIQSEDSFIEFCITWEFKTSQHSLLSSLWVEDSIQGYTDAALKVYKDLAGVNLAPTQQQNQAGFSTHLFDLLRGPGQIIYTKGKIPDMWSNEAKQLSFTPEALKEKWKTLNFATQEAYNKEIAVLRKNNIFDLNQERELREIMEKSRKNIAVETIQKEFENEELDVYYKNVVNNLENFRKVFQKRFEYNISSFPFEEMIKSTQQCPSP